MTIPDAQMPPAPQPPRAALPPGACDAHVHLLAGADEFPLWERRVENPAPGPDLEGWLGLYRAHLETLGFERGVIVHSILYGTDNTVTIEAVKRMGPGFCGVGLLPDGAGAAQIRQFARDRMAAVRLNYVHGGVLSWEGAKEMAPLLADAGLHIQMLCHADRHMEQIADDIRAMPTDVVIDHLGWPSQGLDPSGAGVQTLCRLLAEGKVWVKLSAPYRMCPAPYEQAIELMQTLIAANPERCLWGSDWPHLMLAGAEMPHSHQLLAALEAALPDAQTRAQIFVHNPAQLFRF
jgi:predicted TIM-barrel fold metal-dependent hydrolase